jgi:hypothetical protein
MVERLIRIQEVTGSMPVFSNSVLWILFFFFFFLTQGFWYFPICFYRFKHLRQLYGYGQILEPFRERRGQGFI